MCRHLFVLSFLWFVSHNSTKDCIAGLKLSYRGRKGYLSEAERQEIIDWLKTKDYWNFDELITHIEVNYDVIYQSKQSDDDLFPEAGITWKKSQKFNPKADPEVVKKQVEIREFIGANQSEIESGRLVVLFLDACHLCWGDVCGYVWGRSDMRVEIPIANERRRQTYFGALNYQTKEFILREWCE